MQFIGLVIVVLFGIWVWERHPALVLLVGGFLGLFIINAIVNARDERARVARMTPEEREQYEREKLEQAQVALFGPVNEHLVCPHCTSPGQVRSKAVTRQTTSVTNTIGRVSATTMHQVTQRHCDKCGSTWDI